MQHLDLKTTSPLRAKDYLLAHAPAVWQAMPQPREHNFTRNYVWAQRAALDAHEARADMPVIDEGDLVALKDLLRGRVGAEGYAMEPRNLRPLQGDVHVDVCVTKMAQEGYQGSIDYVWGNHLLVSQDHHIIDGHHRWLSGMMLNMRLVRVLRVNLPAELLLVLATGLSDRMHHVRNT